MVVGSPFELLLVVVLRALEIEWHWTERVDEQLLVVAPGPADRCEAMMPAERPVSSCRLSESARALVLTRYWLRPSPMIARPQGLFLLADVARCQIFERCVGQDLTLTRPDAESYRGSSTNWKAWVDRQHCYSQAAFPAGR